MHIQVQNKWNSRKRILLHSTNSFEGEKKEELRERMELKEKNYEEK